MATLTEIKNNVHIIENISEEVFKYEMEISHLHENSEYYIINYYKIYTSGTKGYNYILKNADGNYYWATPGAKNFIESSHYPEFEIKTYSFYKLIDNQGNTYLDEHKNPILELEADFEKVDKTKIYKPIEKQVEKNKVVDDYYISRYIYGLKYSLDTCTSQKLKTPKTEVEKSTVPLTDIRNKCYEIKEQLKIDSKNIKDIKNKFDNLKDLSEKLTEIKETLECNEVIKSHIAVQSHEGLENLEKYFKQYHESHEISEDIKFRFDNLEKYVKEKYENETKIFIKFYINEPNKEKLKIHLDNIEKYVIDYYEAEAKRILRYY